MESPYIADFERTDVDPIIIDRAGPINGADQVTNMIGMSAFDAVDGSSTGTEVPWMWVLLRPPRFGGAKHASGYDNRSRHRQVGFSNPRS